MTLPSRGIQNIIGITLGKIREVPGQLFVRVCPTAVSSASEFFFSQSSVTRREGNRITWPANKNRRHHRSIVLPRSSGYPTGCDKTLWRQFSGRITSLRKIDDKMVLKQTLVKSGNSYLRCKRQFYYLYLILIVTFLHCVFFNMIHNS